MDDQNFDDIIKGKLENYQDTGDFNPGALDNMLDNLPTGGGGGGSSGASLPGWAQSAWVPIGLGATLLLNAILITMLWTQKRTINEVKEELQAVKIRTQAVVHDTIVVARKDTVYLKGSNSGLNQAGFAGNYKPYYSYNQRGTGNYKPYYSYNQRGTGNYKPYYNYDQRGTGNYKPYYNYDQRGRGNNNNNASRFGRYPANTKNQPYFRAGGYLPNQQNRQGRLPNNVNAQSNTVGNPTNTKNPLPNNSGNNTGNTNKPHLISPAKKEAKLRLMASLLVDSIRLLPRQENDQPYDSWSAEVKEVPELTPKVKKKRKKAFWNNIGVQLGVSAGVTSPIFDLGNSQVAIPLGLKAEISLGERLRIHTGIDFYKVSQNISSLPTNLDDFTKLFPDLSTDDDQDFTGYEMEATVVEIPVQLRYMFGSRFSNIKPFAGVGIIARKMSGQETSYNYIEEQQSEVYNETYVGSSPFRLTNYQVTFGAETYLSKNINLQLGAYYNGGLKPLSYDGSQFNNLGMSAALFFTLK